MIEARRLLESVKREIDADAHLRCLLCYEEKGHCVGCPAPEIDAYLAQPDREGELVAALEAQKAAHDYRFGPAGKDAETGEEMNAFMLKVQELDETAWQLTRDALGEKA